jgi:hypothetical protein
MRIDSMESEISISVGTDAVEPLTISATVDNTIQSSTTLSVFDTARVVISREGVSRVASDPQKVVLRVEGSDKKPIVGFNSVAHLSLPAGAGSFSPSVITLRDGISDVFEYIP